MLNTNIQSLVPKLDILSLCVKANNVGVACITETWLKSTVPSSVIDLPGYTVVWSDRNSQMGGGVCCYIKEDIPYKVWSELRDCEVESLWLTLRPPRMPRSVPSLSFGVIYMPPGSTQHPRKERPVINHITHCLDFISNKNPQTGFIVTGDLTT